MLAYGAICLGYARVGSALASVVHSAFSQICTAVMRSLILRRHLPPLQLAAVAVVVAGLLLRGLAPELKLVQLVAAAVGGGSGGATDNSGLWLGIGLVAASALGYSLLGVVYEWLVMLEGPGMSHTALSLRTSVIGLVALSTYQVVYTLPRCGRKSILYNAIAP